MEETLEYQLLRSDSGIFFLILQYILQEGWLIFIYSILLFLSHSIPIIHPSSWILNLHLALFAIFTPQFRHLLTSITAAGPTYPVPISKCTKGKNIDTAEWDSGGWSAQIQCSCNQLVGHPWTTDALVWLLFPSGHMLRPEGASACSSL